MSDPYAEFVESLLRGQPQVPSDPAALDAEFDEIMRGMDGLDPGLARELDELAAQARRGLRDASGDGAPEASGG